MHKEEIIAEWMCSFKRGIEIELTGVNEWSDMQELH